jgi:hypothetical protein
MGRSGSRELTAPRVARDAWRATRGSAAALAARQADRLKALVQHARQASRFYAEHYRPLPSGSIGPEAFYQLPPVTKPELMARFDDWVTDPSVTRAAVEEFAADLDNLGKDFLGRYVVFTTSGSTGVPALLVQDRRAVAVMTGLSYVRALGALTPRLLARMLTRQPRQAAVFATGGHFLSTTMFQRRLRTAPFRRRITRFYSVLDPLPQLVDQVPGLSGIGVRTRCQWVGAGYALGRHRQSGSSELAANVEMNGLSSPATFWQPSAGRALTRSVLAPRPPPYQLALLDRPLARRAGLRDTGGTRFSTGTCGLCGLRFFLAR